MTWQPPPLDSAVELRDHLPQEGWRTAVREICARHELDADDLDPGDLAPFASGSDVVWAAGERVVKLTAPRWARQIEAEARCLEHVAGRLSVRTPVPVATGELAGWPYLVMSRLPGVALGSIWPHLDRHERMRLAADLGRLTRELHALDVVGLPDEWDAFWVECRENAQQRDGKDGVPEELAAAVGPFLESFGELATGPRVFLHTELMDQHVLLEERGGRLELGGLIDFADARIGPADYDFPAPVEFVFRGEPGLLHAFLRAYGCAPEELTPERSERLLAWGLSHRFGRLRRMLQAALPARPATLPELARCLYGAARQGTPGHEASKLRPHPESPSP